MSHNPTMNICYSTCLYQFLLRCLIFSPHHVQTQKVDLTLSSLSPYPSYQCLRRAASSNFFLILLLISSTTTALIQAIFHTTYAIVFQLVSFLLPLTPYLTIHYPIRLETTTTTETILTEQDEAVKLSKNDFIYFERN